MFSLKNYGGEPGILSDGNIEYLIDRISYESDPIKASAILLHGFTTLHPFIDGNKRIGFLAADILLQMNEYYLTGDQDEAISFGLEIAQDRISIEETEAWIRSHSARTSSV